ncbi:MAG: pyrophosphatase PpaX [Bacillota bacterium]
MYKGVLFDLDGTLIDTNELIIRSYLHTLKSQLNVHATRQEIVQYFGEPLKITLGRYCSPRQLPDVVKCYRKYNIENHDALTKVFPHVPETLEFLSQKEGFKIAVVTSKMRDTAIKGLRLFGLLDYVDILIGFEDTEEHKPKAAPVIKALNKLGLKPEDALMVGDSPNDIRSAHDAGVPCAVVEYSIIEKSLLAECKPEYWLKTIKDVLKLVRKAY